MNGHGNLGEKGACLSEEKGGVFVGNGEMGHHLIWKLDMGFAVLVLDFFFLVLGTWGNGSCKSKKNWIGEVGNRGVWVW